MTKPKKHRGIMPLITCCEDPSKRDVLRAAMAYLDAGLSLIPITADGSKQPAFPMLPRVTSEEGRERRSWGVYRERQPTPDEVRKWFWQRCPDDEFGLAILGGAVSGGLEIIDFDTADLFEPWSKIVEKKAPGLIEKLVTVRTPRPGVHVYCRCEESTGNQKLARVPAKALLTGKTKAQTLIETKSEGGYCLAPPSPRRCHPMLRCYTFLGDNDLTKVPTITPEERAVLLEAARSFDQWKNHRKRVRRRVVGRGKGAAQATRPGDDFNARADWGDILEPHGWRLVGDDGDQVDYWCRPDKSQGTSATTNYEGSDLFYVFSTNADPFESETAYSKFHAYTLLEHDGDFRAAARALARKGYGRCRGQSRAKVNVEERYSGRRLRSRRQ